MIEVTVMGPGPTVVENRREEEDKSVGHPRIRLEEVQRRPY